MISCFIVANAEGYGHPRGAGDNLLYSEAVCSGPLCSRSFDVLSALLSIIFDNH
jgi:hypothetical protein